MTNLGYKVTFTQSAKVEAAKRGLSLETLTAYIVADMRDNDIHEGEDADCHPSELIFHTVDYDEPKPWLVYGKGDDGILIDSATYEDGGILEEGPFKGKKLSMPRGDEDDSPRN